MTENIVEVIRMGSIFSVVAPILFFLILFKKLPTENRIIGTLVLLNAGLDLCIHILYSKKMSTAMLFNAGHVLQFLVIACYYYEVMFKKYNRQVFYLSIVTFFFSYVLIGLFLQKFSEHQTWMWSVSALILVGYALLLYNTLSLYPPILDINLYSRLTINGAILIYFSFNLFLFGISSFYLTEENRDMGRMFWSFHNINNIIKNLIMALGLFYTGRRIIDVTTSQREVLERNSNKFGNS